MTYYRRRHRFGFFHMLFWGAIAFWPLGVVGWNLLGWLAELAYLGFAAFCWTLARRLERRVSAPDPGHRALPADDGYRLL